MTSPDTDEALMLAAKAGDVAAFTSLAGRYGPRVLAYCLHSTKHRASAEEVAQETWLGLWRARASYESTTTFAAWLFAAARNRCRNRHRGVVRAFFGLGRTAEDDVDSLVTSSPSVLDDIVLAERRRNLATKMQLLSDALREALVLRVVDELSYADISVVLGIPEATARSRVRLAVEKLRELVNEEVL